MAIEFWCVECLKKLTASDTDAGRPVECAGCGSVVTVPRNPGPESEADIAEDRPDGKFRLSPAAIDSARTGLRLLQSSLLLFVVQMAVCGGILISRAAADGFVNAYPNGPYPDDIPAEVGLVVTLIGTTARGALRIVGYIRCLKLARWVEAGGTIVPSVFGVLTYTAGVALLELPPLVAPLPNPFSAPIAFLLLMAAIPAVLTGFCLEWGVLRFCEDLLSDTLGPAEGRRVITYRRTFRAPLVPCAVAYVSAMTVGIASSFLPWLPARVFAVMPAVFDAVAGVALGAAFLLGIVLSWQYFVILSRCRAGLAASRALEPPP
jgi:DNA-directed RNA polymerase subunit RPC12/RpoP